MLSEIRVARASRVVKINDSLAMIEITPLSGEVVNYMIDAEDIPKVQAHRWFFENGYCYAMKNAIHWALTWELLGRPGKGSILHHVNGNP